MDEVMALTAVEEEIAERLEKRIPYVEEIFLTKANYDNIIEDIILEARNIALSHIYPFNEYPTLQLPTRYINWQYRCCIELYNLADKRGFSTYSENGLSWGKLTDGLSEQLMSELMSKVGIPKRKKEETEDVGN